MKPELKVVDKTETPAALSRDFPIDDQEWDCWFEEDELAKEWEEREAALEDERRKEKNRVHVSETIETLSSPLSPDERLDLAELMAEAQGRKEKAEAEINGLKDRLKPIIKEAETEIADAARELRANSKEAQVTVRKTIDYELGIVSEIRLDTGEEISSRGIRESERQMRFRDVA